MEQLERYRLSEDAKKLGFWIAENSESGGFDRLDYDDISEQFPVKERMLEAVGELQMLGLADIAGVLGQPFRALRPTYNLFRVFDPLVSGRHNPEEDAAIIALELLNSKDREMVDSSELCKKLGWSVRRINPALGIVGSFIGRGRKFAKMGGPFVIGRMFVSPVDRAMLRRFVSQVRGK